MAEMALVGSGLGLGLANPNPNPNPIPNPNPNPNQVGSGPNMYQVWLGGDPAQGERTAQPTSIFKVLPQTPSPCGPPNAHPDPKPNPTYLTLTRTLALTLPPTSIFKVLPLTPSPFPLWSP